MMHETTTYAIINSVRLNKLVLANILISAIFFVTYGSLLLFNHKIYGIYQFKKLRITNSFWSKK